MKSIKHFIQNVTNSFYNPSFYAGLRDTRVGSGMSFVFLLSFVVMLVAIARFSIVVLPQINTANIDAIVTQYYPQELDVQINNGVASTSVAQPYAIAVPADWTTKKPSPYKNILVIDTTKSVSLDTVASSSTFAFLSKDSLTTVDQRNGIRVMPLKGITGLTINKAQLEKWGKNIVDTVHTMALPVALISLLVGSFLYWLSRLFVTLFGAILTLIIARIKGVKLSYKEAYTISLFAGTPGIILMILLSFGSLIVPSTVSIVLFILIIAINIQKVDNPLVVTQSE